MSVIVTDNFNRADTASLGTNWTIPGPGWTIFSNQAKAAVGTEAHSCFTGAAWTGGADHYSEAQYVTNGMTGDLLGASARLSTSAVTAYAALVDGTSFALFKIVAAAYTSLASVSGGVLNNTLRCEAQGTTIRSVLNGTVKSTVTDAAIASGNPGVAYSTVAFAFDGVLDNFAAGDFAGSVRPARAGRPFPFKPGSPRR